MVFAAALVFAALKNRSGVPCFEEPLWCSLPLLSAVSEEHGVFQNTRAVLLLGFFCVSEEEQEKQQSGSPLLERTILVVLFFLFLLEEKNPRNQKTNPKQKNKLTTN